MKIFCLFLLLFALQFVSSSNLRNLLLTAESDNYKKLAIAVNKTFYKLYNITIDSKDKNIITYEDIAKYYRIIINEYDDGPLEESNDNSILLQLNKNDLSFPNIPTIITNLTFDIFGRTYRLYDEYKAMINIFLGIFESWDSWVFKVYKRNMNKFESQITITFFCTDIDSINKNGSFSITIEDKDDEIEIIDSLSSFWEKYREDIPTDYTKFVIIISEIIVNNLALKHNAINRREKLANSAIKLFHQLYNMSIDFNNLNVITHNDDMNYYKIILEEFPKPQDGLDFTVILIENGRFFIPDIPKDLTFTIFGRSYNLKQEYEAILYTLAPAIYNGEIELYKNDINTFEPEIRYKCNLYREGEENLGLFHVIFEDKDDKLTIEETLETFWSTYKDKIPNELVVDVKIAAQFVVTTFGIWHNIANRYDKIVKAANNTLFQVFNITLDFNKRYVVTDDNEYYYIRITIDEFPEIPKDVATYFDINSGRATFPKIEFVPDVKFEIFEKSLDLEKEYKSIANMFAAGIRNGKVYIYQKDIDKKVTEIRFKSFVYSESGDTYGSFEISLVDKNDKKTIEEALEEYWKKLTNIAESVLEKIKYISDFVGRVIGVKDEFIKKISSSSSSSSYTNLSLISLLTLIIF